MAVPRYRRILLKLSGEALMGEQEFGLDTETVDRIASEIKTVAELGVEVCIVVGGGNIFRGAGLAGAGMDRVTGDHMGMLATVINALAMQDALERLRRLRSQGKFPRPRLPPVPRASGTGFQD